jgi:hypothetical protein
MNYRSEKQQPAETIARDTTSTVTGGIRGIFFGTSELLPPLKKGS